MMGPTSRPAKDVDAYLARVPEPARTALQKLRRTIRAAAPKATETISYRIPTLRHLGMLVGFGATSEHCALYVLSGTVLAPFEKELRAFDTSKGTIRFQPDAPLPAAIVKRIVSARIAENEARAKRNAGPATGAKGKAPKAPVAKPKAGRPKR
jgi:uncharacterized protein YdhG (YjbR/CyaY superfamily)